MSTASHQPDETSSWLERLDLEQPVSAFIDQPAWLETPQLDQQELARLDSLVSAYVQELEDKHLIPDIPPMDMDERLLTPDHEPDHDIDR